MTSSLGSWVLPAKLFSCGSSEPRNSSSYGFGKCGNCHFFYACRCHKALISETRNFKLKVTRNSMGGLESWAIARLLP